MKDQASHPQDEAIRRRARESFEQSVANLDQATGNRLRLMRREAIAGSRPKAVTWGLPMVAAAAAVLAIGLAWRTSSPVASPLPAVNGAPDEVSATGFPSEEDADLYAWLGEAPVAPAKGGAL